MENVIEEELVANNLPNNELVIDTITLIYHNIHTNEDSHEKWWQGSEDYYTVSSKKVQVNESLRRGVHINNNNRHISPSIIARHGHYLSVN